MAGSTSPCRRPARRLHPECRRHHVHPRRSLNISRTTTAWHAPRSARQGGPIPRAARGLLTVDAPVDRLGTRVDSSTASAAQHRTERPTERQRAHRKPRVHIDYLWSGEPSTGVSGPVEVGPGRQARSLSASKPTSSMSLTPAEGTWLVKACGRDLLGVGLNRHGRLASGPRADEVVAARWSGAWAYLRHAAVAGDMKPCGHDHRELTHVGDRTAWWVMPIMRAARWPWPDLTPPRRGSGSHRRAGRRRRG